MPDNRKSREILSAYFDNEVPSPWKESVEKRIEIDPDNKNTFESYKKLRDLLHRDDKQQEGTIPNRQHRVWERLSKEIFKLEQEKEQTINLGNPIHRTMKTEQKGTAVARFSIPLPIAAAASIFLVLITILIQTNINPVINDPVYANLDQQGSVLQAIPTGLEALDTSDMPSDGPLVLRNPSTGVDILIRAQDLKQLAEILQGTVDSGTDVREITIQLPESESFEFLGEPMLIPKDAVTNDQEQ